MSMTNIYRLGMRMLDLLIFIFRLHFIFNDIRIHLGTQTFYCNAFCKCYIQCYSNACNIHITKLVTYNMKEKCNKNAKSGNIPRKTNKRNEIVSVVSM